MKRLNKIANNDKFVECGKKIKSIIDTTIVDVKEEFDEAENSYYINVYLKENSFINNTQLDYKINLELFRYEIEPINAEEIIDIITSYNFEYSIMKNKGCWSICFYLNVL